MYSILKNYRIKVEHRRKRKIIRSYNLLNKENRINILSKISEDLTKTKLDIPQNQFDKYIFGTGVLDAEIALRQQLIYTLIYSKLNKKILLSYSQNKKLKYPLPIQWLKIIENYGIKISYSWSLIYFNFFIIKSFLSAIIFQIKNVFELIFFQKIINNEKHIQFTDLGLTNLPIDDNDIDSHNLINWYIKNRIKSNESRIIKHNVKGVDLIQISGITICSNSNFIPGLTFRNSINYILSIIFISFKSFGDILRGRWWHPFLLKQASISKRFKFAKKEQLAEEYLFSNSNWLNRPLWTYEAAAKGAKITLFFYSTNCQYFNFTDQKKILPIGYNAMNWPNYLVWDDFQSEFIKQLNNYNPNIYVVGPIWFQFIKSTDTLIKNKSIAVFDVSPYRDSIYSTLGVPDRYYRSINNLKFLNDITEIASKYNYIVKFKQKRDLKNSFELNYINYIKKIKLNKNIQFIESNISAFDVIESSELVVSMPFTSTSIIAKEYGYKSAYYDPTGNLYKSDPAAHGVLLLSNKIELEQWILNN